MKYRCASMLPEATLSTPSEPPWPPSVELNCSRRERGLNGGPRLAGFHILQCGAASLPAMSWASRPALHAQPPDSGKRVTFKEKNPMRPYFKHLHPSPLPSGPKNPAPPATMQTESRQENHLGGGKKINAIPPRESWKQRMGATKVAKVAKVATSGVARVSRRAVSPFVATYPCSKSSRHGSRHPAPPQPLTRS